MSGNTSCQDDTAGAAGGNDDVDVDFAAKFTVFCDKNSKDHFTSKHCNKLVKDCFEEHFKYKGVILTNRIDSSVFSKCKEKGKPHMVVNNDNCKRFLRLAAHEFAKLQKSDDKLAIDDPAVKDMYEEVKAKIINSTGRKIKSVKSSTTGNVAGLTDTRTYTGSHKLRFDETGKGRGKAGRVDDRKTDGYVANYKGEGTYDESNKKK